MKRIPLETTAAPSVRRALAATALCIAAAAGSAAAAPPANDNFAAAAEITGALPLSVTGTNVEATLEAGEPVPEDPDAGRTTIWWKWTAAESGIVDIYSEGGLQDPEWSDDTDEAVHAVYTGDSLATLTPVPMVSNSWWSAEDPWLFQSRFAAVAGTAYRIQGRMNFADVENTITLTIKPGPPVPPNNAFTDAPSLTTGVPASGTYDGATVEAGERVPQAADPNHYPATVWWKWTAPAPGWHTVRLVGEDYGPTLAVWKGNTPGSVTEVRSVGMQGSTLEGKWVTFVYIQAAAAGEEFRISVGGDSIFGEPLTLTVDASAEPPLRNTSLTFTPAAVDVTDGPATAFLEFHLVSSVPVTSGGFFLDLLPTVTFGPSQRVSGTATDGSYRVPVAFPAGIEPGEYTLRTLYINEPGAPRDLYLGAGHPLDFAAGSVLDITVTNSGPVDTAPPEVKSATVSPTALTLDAEGNASVTVTLRITDTLAGFADGYLWFFHQGGGFDSAGYADINPSMRISGDAWDGVYSVPVDLTRFAGSPVGDFYLSISLEDSLWNSGDDVDSLQPSFPGPFRGTIRINRPGGENPVTFASWAERAGLTGEGAAPTADPDGDGVTNLMEYALGMNPRSGGLPEHATADAAGLPSAVPPGGGAAPGPLTLQFWLPSGPDQADLVFKAQFSGDGSQWTDVPASAFTPDPVKVMETPYGQRRLHTVTDPAGAVTAPRMGRVVVTTAP